MHYGRSVKHDLPGLDPCLPLRLTGGDSLSQTTSLRLEKEVPQIEKKSLADLSRRRTDVYQKNNRFPQTVCKLKMLLWEDSRKRILHLLRYPSKDGMTTITPAPWGAVDGSQILDDHLSSKDNDSPLSSALL